MTYTNQNGYQIPNILPAQEPNEPLGKYALLRRAYLKEHRESLFTTLMMTGKLHEHLTEIDQAAREHIQQIVSQTAQASGVTEQLKESDPIKWTGMMNNIRQAAEETVMNELIYN